MTDMDERDRELAGVLSGASRQPQDFSGWPSSSWSRDPARPGEPDVEIKIDFE